MKLKNIINEDLADNKLLNKLAQKIKDYIASDRPLELLMKSLPDDEGSYEFMMAKLFTEPLGSLGDDEAMYRIRWQNEIQLARQFLGIASKMQSTHPTVAKLATRDLKALNKIDKKISQGWKSWAQYVKSM
jgi:hypothetical protein